MANRERIALSWSRLSDYQQCPLKFRLKYIDKVFKFDDKSPHLIRGSNIHEGLETYVIKCIAGQKSGVKMMSQLPEVRNTVPLIDRIMQQYPDVQPEAQVAVNDRYQMVDWFSKDAYWRAIIDLTCLNNAECLVIDWKTGKVRDYLDEFGQLHLTALIIMMAKPEIQKIRVAYVYVDHKEIKDIEVTRAMIPELKEHFDSEHMRMNADHEFKAIPNEFCKWCEAVKAQCPYSRKLQ